MKNKQENLESEIFNKYNGEEAYQTLVNWVKSVPNTIKEIEENGSKEELIRYKKQIKMVVEKLKEIKNNFQKGIIKILYIQLFVHLQIKYDLLH